MSGLISGLAARLANTVTGAQHVGYDGGTLAAFFVAGSLRVEDTIAGMQALDVTQHTRAFVTGYYAHGDGGGGSYWYDPTDTTTTANGGTVLTSSTGTGRWKLTGQRSVNPKQFGAKGNSNGTTGNGNDDTAAIQATISWVEQSGGAFEVSLDESIFRCTAPLAITAPIAVRGETASPKNVGETTVGGGSWLYFDHTGKGITAENTNGNYKGVSFVSFGTLRNQPAIGAGWTPTANDFDFYSSGVDDITYEDLLLLNPTQGISINSTNNGRANFYKIRMQPMQVGIQVDQMYDVMRMDQIHFWSFWSENDTNVPTYTQAHLDCIRLYRVDNPMLSNIFGIHCYSLVRVAQSANGTTTKIHLTNADADQAQYGVWYDSSVVAGASGQFENITYQSTTPPLTGSKAVYVQGTGIEIEFGKLSSINTGTEGVHVEGSNNTVRFGELRIQNYDQDSGANVAAVTCTTGNRVFIDGWPDIGGDGGTGGRYSKNGNISVDDWQSFTPTVTASSGTITTLGTVAAKYKLVKSTVTVDFTVNVTTNGTAAGGMRVTHPVSTPVDNFVGAGKERSVGKGLTVGCTGSSTFCTVVQYDGTYPAFNGAVIDGTYSYDLIQS